MMVMPTRMMGWTVQVKAGVKEEEEARIFYNDLGCTHADKVECLDCRTY